MFNKKLLFSLIFIMLVVGISYVSAEDIDDIGDLSSNDADDVISVDESLDDNVGVDESEVLADQETSTIVNDWNGLGGAVYNSNYDTVYLGANITPGNQIVINHDVTIIGSADSYIGGSSSSNPVSYSNIPIYSSASGLSITLKNIRFQNCGGNILMKFSGNGNYVLDNCTFENVTATGSHQAVVHLNLGYCDIINCTFEKCTTSYGTVSNYNENSVTNVHMTVRDTTFKNNNASVEPGAINNCGQLIVYDSIFEGNSAAWWAGAIHTHTNANTTVVRSSFRNNIAEWNGGALYTYSHLTVINSTFTGNEAHGSNGGAIAGSSYGSRPYLTVINSEFDSNIASGSGGAISFGSSELIVNNSVFNNNKALSGTGGAISTSGATSTITYSNFTKNNASGRGGAIYATGNGQLNVYYSTFINDTASEGQDLAYHYTGKKNNKAFFNYDYNEFWGVNNASGSIYAYNSYLIDNNGGHNSFHDIDDYVGTGDENTTNDTNGSSGDIIVPDSFNGVQLWNASLSGALGGTPLVNGDRIYVPNGHSIYCLNITNGNLLWNKSSEWGYFHELALHGNVLIAPCAWDKFYMYDATTGTEIQPNSNMYQASSLYAPAIDGNIIYVSSEYGYGANNNKWIAVVEYANGVYNYTGSILEINNASSALISQPIVRNGYLWVNTVNGLMRVNLTTGVFNVVLTNTVGKPVVGGNIIYVLTSDNHICGVDASENLVVNITVSDSIAVGNTLAISNDGTVLYTVCSEGSIYVTKTTSTHATLINKVNPVSSAINVGSNGCLYVGDDAGILWVLNTFYDDDDGWTSNILWTYNVSSAIYGAPVIVGNAVFTGNNEEFYGLCNVPVFNYQLGVNQLFSPGNINELLGMGSNEIIDIIQPGQILETDDFQSDNPYYLDEGTYIISKAVVRIGGTGSEENGNKVPRNNIVVKSKENANVVIEINPAKTRGLSIPIGENITLEGLKFTSTSVSANSLKGFVSIGAGAKNIFIKNCTFENMKTSLNNAAIIEIVRDDSTEATNIHFENCNFINCSANYIIYGHTVQASGLGSIYITNCTFENSIGTKNKDCLYLDQFKEIHLENNNFDSSSVCPITLPYKDNKIYSDVYFNVKTESLTINTRNTIVGELVDDNDNHIYLPNLKFNVSGTEKSPSFDKTTGFYSVEYTPTTNEVSVIGSCSNVAMGHLISEVVKLNAVSSPELTINATDSITYGATAVYVNATLKDDINGENVTFTLSKKGTVIGSVNATITNGFANATFNFNQKLIVGTYTIAVNYGGNDNYGKADASKTLSVNKANPKINVTVNPVYVGDNVIVTITFPDDFTGKIYLVRIKDWPDSSENYAYNPDSAEVITKSVYNFTFGPLPAGKNYIWYDFESTSPNYNNAETYPHVESTYAHTMFNVLKYNPTLNITHSAPVINENVTITVKMDDDINENVTVNINGASENKTLINGKLEFNITDAPYGPQNITVSFAGNDKYNATEKNISFFVDYLDTDLSISAEPVKYGEPLVVMITANENLSGSVIVKIGNVTQNADIVEGNGNATFVNLTAGDHFITASFECDYTFAGDSANTTATVKGVEVPADKAVNTNVPENSKSPTFSINLDKDATGNFTVLIDDGKTFNKTVELKDGSASITVDNLPAGDYKVSISYSGDGKYAPISQNTPLTIKEVVNTPPAKKVTKKATKITAKKKTFKAKVKVKKYTIVLKAGKKPVSKVWVTLKIKGKKVIKAKTNAKGKATFKIKKLTKKGKYSATVKFAGNKNFKASSKKIKITVKK